MIESLSFTVFGRPEPKGSLKWIHPKNAKDPDAMIPLNDNKNIAPWMQQIARCAQLAVYEARAPFVPPMPEPLWKKGLAVNLHLVFYLARPASAKKNVVIPAVRPDLDKLERAVLDALTGILYYDDGQVATVVKGKRFGLPERLELEARLTAAPDLPPPSHTLELFAGAPQ